MAYLDSTSWLGTTNYLTVKLKCLIVLLEYLTSLTALLESIDLFVIFSGRAQQMFSGACAPLGPTVDTPLGIVDTI